MLYQLKVKYGTFWGRGPRERETGWGKLMGLQEKPLAQKGKCEHTYIVMNEKILHRGIHKN